jgi:hypothetical protein
MRACDDTGTNHHRPFAKRVSVRSGGAGHAHSGVIKGGKLPLKAIEAKKNQLTKAEA